MTLSECLQRVSHREYLTWMARFSEEWNRPSRTDYYIMFLIQVVRSLFSKKPVSLESCRLPFTKPGKTRNIRPGRAEIEQASRSTLSQWLRWIGGGKDQK